MLGIRSRLFWAAGCLLLQAALAMAAKASGTGPGVVGRDDRVRLPVRDIRKSPWAAIGQVNVKGYRRRGACTGTLVAPNAVITAAHCLRDPRTRAPARARRVHFVIGHRGSIIEDSAVRCLKRLAPDSGLSPRGAEAIANDVAVLILKSHLKTKPARLADDALAAGRKLPLIHAAYPTERRNWLMLHRGCRRTGTAASGRVWLTDCDTQPASSGGPVFVDTGKTPKLAAVMVGASRGTAGTLVSTIQAWRRLTADPSCPPL